MTPQKPATTQDRSANHVVGIVAPKVNTDDDMSPCYVLDKTPPELRIVIYEAYFSDYRLENTKMMAFGSSKKDELHCPLLSVCPLMRREALPVYKKYLNAHLTEFMRQPSNVLAAKYRQQATTGRGRFQGFQGFQGSVGDWAQVTTVQRAYYRELKNVELELVRGDADDVKAAQGTRRADEVVEKFGRFVEWRHQLERSVATYPEAEELA